MKGDTQVVLLIVFCLTGFFLGITLSGGASAISNFNDYIVAFTTLLAAFLGSKYAFHLQKEKELKTDEAKKVEAANRAIFTIIRNINKVRTVVKQFVDPFRDHEFYFLAIPPVVGITKGDASINYDEISFIFDSDDPNLMVELSTVEAELNATLDVVLYRSELHFNQIQPRVEAAGFVDFGEYSKDDVVRAIGVRLYETMRHSTQQMVSSLDDLDVSLTQLENRMHGVVKKQFRGHAVIGMAGKT